MSKWTAHHDRRGGVDLVEEFGAMGRSFLRVDPENAVTLGEELIRAGREALAYRKNHEVKL